MNYFDVLFAKKLAYNPPLPPVIKRVTGNPVEFSDGANAPLVKCVTEIQGSQDLHGYDKPWAPGAGKNKLPLILSDIKAANTSGTWSGNNYLIDGITFEVNTDADENVVGIEISGTASNNAKLNINGINLASGSYIVSTGAINPNPNVVLVITPSYNATSDVITVTTNINNSYIQISNGTVLSDFKFYPMIRLSTETAPTFAPYSNICPITAYTENTISECGRNLVDIHIIPSTNYEHTYFNQPINYPITFSVKNNAVVLSENAWRIQVKFQDNTSTYITDNNFPITITPTEGNPVVALICRGNTMTSGSYDVMCVKGSTPYPYEPYTNTDHTSTFSVTIYRGSEDVVNGSVTSEWIKVVFDGSDDENWTRFSSGSAGAYAMQIPLPDYVLKDITDADPTVKANYLQTIGIDTTWGNYDGFISRLSNVSQNIAIGIKSITTVEDWRTYLSNNPLEIVYELDTPSTENVTPSNLPVMSLSGYNNIESTTGDMVIDYITDQYQNFVDTVNRAVPSTRKGGTKALDVFLSFEPQEPEPEKEEDTKKNIQEEK